MYQKGIKSNKEYLVCECIVCKARKEEEQIEEMTYLNKVYRRIRNSPYYYTWRNTVLKKDEYTCQKCGIKNKSLQAHHKKRVKDYPELAFIVENGITLCTKCHKKEEYK